MTVKTQLKGGRLATNHNPVVSLKVATKVKGGRLAQNHNPSVR